MSSHSDLYNKVGIYKIVHFINPPVIKADTFYFPDKSILYWFKPDTGLTLLDRSIPYLNRTKKADVTTITKLLKGSKGKTKESSVKEINDLIKEQIKLEKRYNFLEPNVIGTGDFVIYNYGMLNYVNNYPSTPDLLDISYHNVTDRMFYDIKSNKTSHRYIVMDVPHKLLSIDMLDTLTKRIAIANLNKIDYKHMNIIELWKWLTPEYKSESIFNKISNDNLSRTTLLLYIDNKCILLNLYILYKIITEYEDNKYAVNTESLVDTYYNLTGRYYLNTEDIDITTKAYSAKNIRQIVYILLYQLVNGKSDSLDKINKETETEVTIKSAINASKTIIKKAKVNVDDILQDSVDDKNLLTLDGVEEELELDLDFDIDTLEETESALATNINRTFNSIEELKKYDYQDDNKLKIIKQLDYLRENKLITKAKYEKYLKDLEEQENIHSPFLGLSKDKTMKDFLDDSTDDFEIKDIDKQISDSVILFDKSSSKNTLQAIQDKYLREQYRKDISRVVYSLQNRGNIILSYDVDTEFDIMGGIEEHNIEIMSLSGKKTNLSFQIPYIDDDGTFTIYGNKYLLRKMRTEKPIIKTNGTTVLLNSYYGKVFLNKANYNYSTSNVGIWFRNYLQFKNDNRHKLYDSKISNITYDTLKLPEVNLPLLYSQIARFVMGFEYNGIKFSFNYPTRFELTDKYTEEQIVKIEDNSAILIGSKGNTLYLLDYANNIITHNGTKATNETSIYNFLDIDTYNMPIEYVGISIIKQYLAVVIVLGYYLGLTNLLNMLKVKYDKIDGNKRVTTTNDQYSIRFSDCKLVITKDSGISDLILGGLIAYDKITKDYKLSDFDNKEKYRVVLHSIFNMDSSIRYINEIELLESMFIDPMTKNLLKQLKEPENFPGLLIRGCEMLLNDNYKHPNDITNLVIKGYERVCGMVYKEIVYALKDYENKSNFSNAKIVFDKFAIMNKINEDSTKVPIDDTNPVATIKQKEDLSFLGDGGRKKETMVKSTREIHTSEIGVVSEGSKDSGNVGITAYMSANPVLDNISGIVSDNKDKKIGWQNILSTTSMLAPFGINDDVKRLNFHGIQSQHIIPMNKMVAPYILTGYETIIPIKAGSKFATIAEEEGVVIKVTKSEVTVKYKTKGEVKYKLYSWTTKEEASSCYTHELVTSLEVGTKVVKDDTITYDKLFFEPCIFEPKRVIYKQGCMVNMALFEDPETAEDSTAISERLNEVLGTTVTKVKSFVLDKNDNVLDLIQVGKQVEPNDTLFTILSADLPMTSNYDKKSLGILKDLGSSSPKAKLKGIVSKIVVYYNFNKETASKSVQSLIDWSDKILKSNTGFVGKVNNNYSIAGVPLEEDKFEIKVYIDITERMGTGDKCIVGNQLKCTVGEVFGYDMKTEDGTDIDILFSNRAISARIVTSPNLIGTTSTLLKRVEEDVIKMYFG